MLDSPARASLIDIDGLVDAERLGVFPGGRGFGGVYFVRALDTDP